ncbi:MAG: transcriptional repressor LexA [Chloroflexi bacterium]|nr:transcriptional repressor LexA [Chloroflexota bacterium]
MKKLSARQERILQFITDFIEEQGYPPTVRDIQHGCDISSTSVVDYNLNILQREEFIRRSPEISRGLEILKGHRPGARTTYVPVLAYIAAGQPLPDLSAEHRDAPLEILEVATNRLNGESDVYALRVRGTSMIDALIADGDIVIVKPADTVKDGDTVVAWLKRENEATLKRFYHEGDRIRLQPANTRMEPIYVSPDNLDIQGKVITVLRDLA